MRRLIALVTVLLPLVMISAPASAQSPPPDDTLIGHYRGFAQSALNFDLRMAMALTIDRTDGSKFFGRLTLGSMPFDVNGRNDGWTTDPLEDAVGQFKGRGSGEAGEVTLVGTAQSFGEGGVLVRATYKFTPATGGPADQGTADFLRAPHLPPDPVVPVGGTYRGTYASGLGRGPGTLRLELIQDGTSLTGQMFLDEGTAKTLSGALVGGIQPNGLRLPFIASFGSPGSALAGRLLAGGRFLPPPDDGTPAMLKGTFFLEFLGGGVDLGMFEAARTSEPR
jgi:hypothetical protein